MPGAADGSAALQVLLRQVCAWVAVSVHALQFREDLRKTDGGDIATHMETVNTVLEVPGISFTEEQLELSVRCAAEVLLQLAPQVEEVRARQCRFVLVWRSMLAGLFRCGGACWHMKGAALIRPAPRCMLAGKHTSQPALHPCKCCWAAAAARSL